MKRSYLAIIIILIILIAGVAWALNHNNKNSNQTNTNATPTSTTTTPSSSTSSVDIKNMMFTPSQVTIDKGTTVTWTNNDNVAHTVTADNNQSFDSGTIDPGKTYSFNFNTAGSYQYHCTIHSSMRGTIVVR